MACPRRKRIMTTVLKFRSIKLRYFTGTKEIEVEICTSAKITISESGLKPSVLPDSIIFDDLAN